MTNMLPVSHIFQTFIVQVKTYYYKRETWETSKIYAKTKKIYFRYFTSSLNKYWKCTLLSSKLNYSYFYVLIIMIFSCNSFLLFWITSYFKSLLIGLSNAIKNEVSHALKMKRNYEKRNSECRQQIVQNKIGSYHLTELSYLCSSFKNLLNKVPRMVRVPKCPCAWVPECPSPPFECSSSKESLHLTRNGLVNSFIELLKSFQNICFI